MNIGEQFEVAPRIAKALVADAGKNRLRIDANAVYVREVPDAHVGVLYVNGKLERELEPGLHVFWKVNRGIDGEHLGQARADAGGRVARRS